MLSSKARSMIATIADWSETCADISQSPLLVVPYLVCRAKPWSSSHVNRRPLGYCSLIPGIARSEWFRWSFWIDLVELDSQKGIHQHQSSWCICSCRTSGLFDRDSSLIHVRATVSCCCVMFTKSINLRYYDDPWMRHWRKTECASWYSRKQTTRLSTSSPPCFAQCGFPTSCK